MVVVICVFDDKCSWSQLQSTPRLESTTEDTLAQKKRALHCGRLRRKRSIALSFRLVQPVAHCLKLRLMQNWASGWCSRIALSNIHLSQSYQHLRSHRSRCDRLLSKAVLYALLLYQMHKSLCGMANAPADTTENNSAHMISMHHSRSCNQSNNDRQMMRHRNANIPSRLVALDNRSTLDVSCRGPPFGLPGSKPAQRQTAKPSC